MRLYVIEALLDPTRVLF